MSASGGPNISEDGLVLILDAANVKSYPSSGTSWNDLSGNNITGTLTNGPTFSAGNLGSIVFDGVDDYVLLTSSNLLFGGVNSYTLDFFIKCPHLTTNQTIFANGNLGGSTPANGMWFFKRRSGLGSALVFHGYSTNPRIDLISTNIIPDNNVCSVSVTFDGVSVYNLFINGQLENSITTNSIAAGTGNSFIGTNSANFFGGNIYSAKIYRRALSPQEILQNFNATRSRFGV
jgi:hypothetical protein